MVQLATTAAPTIDWPTIPRDAMRILDIVITLLLLMFFGPLCLAVAICIKATSHGPVIYRQRRIGYLGQEFYCLKFRTMRHDADARLAALLQHDLLARIQWSYDHKLRHDPRITPLGKFLRRSSIDELPQLINVLQGSMSLVGPRPIVAAEIPRYGRRFVHYTAMRPGITRAVAGQRAQRHDLPSPDRARRRVRPPAQPRALRADHDADGARGVAATWIALTPTRGDDVRGSDPRACRTGWRAVSR
jgi:exopolysaccharide production protein ExoY